MHPFRSGWGDLDAAAAWSQSAHVVFSKRRPPRGKDTSHSAVVCAGLSCTRQRGYWFQYSRTWTTPQRRRRDTPAWLIRGIQRCITTATATGASLLILCLSRLCLQSAKATTWALEERSAATNLRRENIYFCFTQAKLLPIIPCTLCGIQPGGHRAQAKLLCDTSANCRPRPNNWGSQSLTSACAS